MARICPLFSSSKGNCTLIGSSDKYILIDAGVSARMLTTALSERGVAVSDIAAIFVTHEHEDHIKGIKLFAGKNSIPVYATAGTLREMARRGVLEGVESREMPESVEIYGMTVRRFSTSHDTAQSCGYVVTLTDGRKAAVATDMGYVSETVRTALRGCDAMVIESNHDEMMLRNGPYPPLLKQRILSPSGHLSNDACAAELAELVRRGSTRFFLGHLSEENNTPALALSCAEKALCAAGFKNGYDYILCAAAPRDNEMVVF